MKKPSAAKKTVSYCLAFILIAAVITGFLIMEPSVKISGFVTLSPARLSTVKTTTRVLDKDNRPVGNSFVTGSKIFVPLSDLPQHTLDAFVSIEDARFFSHGGLDYYRIAGSAYRNIVRGGYKEGASTITQQLVKNTHLVSDKNLRRKVNEMRIAVQVERRYTKNEILEMYLNAINFGSGAHGIGAAARLYFDKDAGQLSLNESALLAAVINNPSRYNPISSPKQCNQRRRLVLSQMLKCHRITPDQYDQNAPQDIAAKGVVFDQYANFLVSDACVALGMSKAEFLSGGYIVTSYMDTDLQCKISELLADYSFDGKAGSIVHAVVMTSQGDVVANASFAKGKEIVVETETDTDSDESGIHADLNNPYGLDNSGKNSGKDNGKENGKNNSIDSGKDSGDIDNGKNSDNIGGDEDNYIIVSGAKPPFATAQSDTNAVQNASNKADKLYICDTNGGNLSEVYRQPGSVIKPAICYAPAMEKKLIVPLTPILDSPVDYGGYTPKNHRRDMGWISAEQALMLSQNIPAVKLLDMCGVDYAKDVATRLGFEFLESDNHLALALGGMERGATLTQIAGAYQAFANGGLFVKGSHIRSIADGDGRIIYSRKHIEKRAVSPETAYFINRILSQCAREGTARRLGRGAAKTGTVGDKNGNTDAYTVAYNGDYVVAVWIGSTGELLPNTVNGATHPCVIAGRILDFLPAGAEFAKPASIVEVDLDKAEYFENHRLVQASSDTPKKDRLTGSFSRDNLPPARVTRNNFILQQSQTCFDAPKSKAAG